MPRLTTSGPVPNRLFLGAAVLAVCAACASQAHDEVDEIEDLIAHGRYNEAVERSARVHRDHPDDREAEELHKTASVAWLLERGRRQTFSDDDIGALESFEQAQAIDPDSADVLAWLDKTKRKLSERWLEIGLELHAADDLEGAVEAYENALQFVPGDASAVNGMASAIIQINYRAGRGQGYFEDGLHALSDYWLEQARSRFAYSGKYQPKHEGTLQRRDQVEELLAEQRVGLAEQFERDRRFAAARNEYRMATLLDPENERAAEGLERTRKEAVAAEHLSRARLEIVRGRFDAARELLVKGRELTQAQLEEFDGADVEVQEARFEQLYGTALGLERDFRYDLAIAKYTELLEQTQYYKDVLTRRETLEEYVRLAGDLYARAQAATSDAERIELLHQIRVFWPEYRDVKQQLDTLEPPQ